MGSRNCQSLFVVILVFVASINAAKLNIRASTTREAYLVKGNSERFLDGYWNAQECAYVSKVGQKNCIRYQVRGKICAWNYKKNVCERPPFKFYVDSCSPLKGEACSESILTKNSKHCVSLGLFGCVDKI